MSIASAGSGRGSGWLLSACRCRRSSSGPSSTTRLFVTTVLNGLTLAALYFLVASGFTLVFGLMRNVNLAHGSLYLLGAYVGWVVGEHSDSWFLAVAAGFVSPRWWAPAADRVFRYMQGRNCARPWHHRLSIMLADVMLWIWGGEIYQFDPPRWIFGSTALPMVGKYPTYRLVVLAHGHRDRRRSCGCSWPARGSA